MHNFITINSMERLVAALRKGEKCREGIKQYPKKTKNRSLVYVVIDTLTGEWKHVYDCFLWAEHKAKEMNDNWSPCTTCAFSDCSKDSDVCMGCDDRGYKRESGI